MCLINSFFCTTKRKDLTCVGKTFGTKIVLFTIKGCQFKRKVFDQK